MLTLRNPSRAAGLAGREGTPVEIVRRLGPDQVDEEVGPMYVVRLPSGLLLHVFADELDPRPTKEE